MNIKKNYSNHEACFSKTKLSIGSSFKVLLKQFPTLFLCSILFAFMSCNSLSDQSITEISYPNADQVAKQFDNPPAEYSITFYWGWDGNVTEEVIKRDLDEFQSKNVQVVTLEPGYNMSNAYLSDAWFEDVRNAVKLAKERGMKVYLVDEGKYPSGFAGGKIVSEVPELCMKVVVTDTIIKVNDGDNVSLNLSENVVSASAYNTKSGNAQIVRINDGKLNWTAPSGEWELLLVKNVIRSSPTRSVNNPSRGKDSRHALIDYLDAKATGKFIEFTHEQYKKYLGDEFGTTILGFRGDEPDYSTRGIPWTAGVFEAFEKMKGYSVQPYLATFFAPNQTEEQKLVKADYWDVWSVLFANNFFKIQADWCAAENVNYLVHLNHEEDMTGLIRSEGTFFRNMRPVQMPGVDVIWHQIWPGEVNPVFPKYASSAAHIDGKLRSFTESFAAFSPQPDIKQAKWILDQQLVRGINMVEVMFVPASSDGESGMRGWLAHDDFPKVARYIQRSCYLLSQGVPAARTGVLFPTSSIWAGNAESDEMALHVMKELLQTQNDFDVLDENSIDSILIMQNGKFINKSGQAYSTIVIPPVSVISSSVLARLEAFEKSGGTVISIGNDSILVADKNFKDASVMKPTWKINESSYKVSHTVLKALPASDFVLDKPCKHIKYTHRRWNGADLYFIFNESEENQSFNVKLEGTGNVQVWDAMTGDISDIANVKNNDDGVIAPLNLKPWETRFIVVGNL
ncbi:MAG: glycosyl hydrolase [Prolixibacteraceae bacterium]|jgi:hypothetical protein|nr:glycosyl hydrolase [Prolixibacteraceae bacterium]